MAMSTGSASQKAFIRCLFSLTADVLPILLALDSFLSLPIGIITYGSYRLAPSRSTQPYGTSECDLTNSNRCATSFPSTVVAIVDCEPVRLNSGLPGSETCILIEPPRDNASLGVCCNRPGASCSSLILCLRFTSQRASDRFRDGVPLAGERGTDCDPPPPGLERSKSSSSWGWSGLSSVRPQKRSKSLSGLGEMLSIMGRSS